MTSSGAKFPTTGTTGSVSPHLDEAWQNPTAIYSDNATGAADLTNTTYVTASTFTLALLGTITESVWQTGTMTAEVQTPAVLTVAGQVGTLTTEIQPTAVLTAVGTA